MNVLNNNYVHACATMAKFLGEVLGSKTGMRSTQYPAEQRTTNQEASELLYYMYFSFHAIRRVKHEKIAFMSLPGLLDVTQYSIIMALYSRQHFLSNPIMTLHATFLHQEECPIQE